jgi:hypothetical protein
MAKERKPEEMTEEEITEANAEQLPDRQALSVIHGFQPVPIVLDPGAGDIGIDPPPAEVA